MSLHRHPVLHCRARATAGRLTGLRKTTLNTLFGFTVSGCRLSSLGIWRVALRNASPEEIFAMAWYVRYCLALAGEILDCCMSDLSHIKKAISGSKLGSWGERFA
eukprot:TRINITY_DN6378_c0_g1_i3.p11 TRINITY_DN6378_c0_g1~~TRINITY_DN6378_c0_g1_i3.p11  ORF type:complete len:105 (-),score=7.95 TRINITY_DN6378_c0_g1_i3:1074-1388(-)